MINADEMTRTDSDSIPTGDMITLQGTEYDLRQPRNLGDAMAKINAPGFDNNYCINGGIHEMKLAAKVRHPDSGRTMIVKTDQPGVQFYTSNFLPDKNNMVCIVIMFIANLRRKCLLIYLIDLLGQEEIGEAIE